MVDDATARAWLAEVGFAEGDLRSEITIDEKMKCPMAWACQSGELGVCKWLHKNGAAEDVTKANTTAGATPMYLACQEGQLSVCKWLFKVGATADMTKANNNGVTPMFIACENGHLPVCKWLFEVGADGDITKADNDGATPMSIACQHGQLSVCQWLFEVGAAEDIPKKNKYGSSPMRKALRNGHLAVCHWLVFNGALNTPPSDQHKDGHVDQAIVKRDTRYGKRHRPALLAWAQDVAATHHTFLHVVLRASVILPDSHHQASPDQRCHLPRLPRVVLERLGDVLGVEVGRRVRNVREFAEALAVIVEEKEKK